MPRICILRRHRLHRILFVPVQKQQTPLAIFTCNVLLLAGQTSPHLFQDVLQRQWHMLQMPTKGSNSVYHCASTNSLQPPVGRNRGKKTLQNTGLCFGGRMVERRPPIKIHYCRVCFCPQQERNCTENVFFGRRIWIPSHRALKNSVVQGRKMWLAAIQRQAIGVLHLTVANLQQPLYNRDIKIRSSQMQRIARRHPGPCECS
mmetsp:Transcript_58923/g.135976  ORF Transcript_58923/g.135976 Transcript_58923/m.135976 type:complete len:203 (-) Transcript_58923:223-831(-)